MPFFEKSLLRRVLLFISFFVIAGGIFTIGLYIFHQRSIPSSSIILLCLLFTLYFGAVYWNEVSRPLAAILPEIRALLTGKKYKHIYTKRVDEFGIISHFFNEVTRNFEKVAKDIKEEKRMLDELEIASSIQKEILPPQTPLIPLFEVVAKNKPAAELGGDSYDFITKGDNTFLYVGDVTGHGVPAALVMMMVNTLLHTLIEVYESAYDVIVMTNKQIKNRIKATMFMTMVMLRWNNAEKKMYYVGCGHEYIIIYRAATEKCEVRQSGGIALGMVADNSKLVKEQEIPLEKGDVIILYSDGIVEGKNMAGEMYGLNRLIMATELYGRQYSSDGIVNYIARDFSRFVENHIQEDDITLIALKYVG